MTDNYQVGGIFEAIQKSTKENKQKKSGKQADTADENENIESSYSSEENKEIENSNSSNEDKDEDEESSGEESSGEESSDEDEEIESSDAVDENELVESSSTLLADLFNRKIVEEAVVEPTEEDIKKFVNEDDLPDEDSINEKSNTDTIKKKKKKKEKEDPERLARTLFVGNVSINVDKKKLKKLFMQYGEIETIRLRSVPTADPKLPKKVALITKKFHSDRNNLNAYVVFKKKECADKAMKCNGVLLGDLHLRVDRSNNKEHDHKRCLFVGNLPFSCLEENIREHFKDCGVVEDVRLIRDKATGLGKGFGYVKFKTPDGVMFGLKLNGSKFNGRSLRVYRSKEQPDRNEVARSKNKNRFGGLRSTTKKDMERGKKMFGTVKPKKMNNAMRRIQEKRTKTKHARNKERNINKKVNNVKKK